MLFAMLRLFCTKNDDEQSRCVKVGEYILAELDLTKLSFKIRYMLP